MFESDSKHLPASENAITKMRMRSCLSIFFILTAGVTRQS